MLTIVSVCLRIITLRRSSELVSLRSFINEYLNLYFQQLVLIIKAFKQQFLLLIINLKNEEPKSNQSKYY